jgi:NTE family protein
MATESDAKKMELRSPLPADSEPSDQAPSEVAGLCLSGGGYRAMLFHAGALWRLNELGWLKKLDRISSVSGGSITAGVLAMNWSRLNFVDGVAQNFTDLLVERVRTLANTSIDLSSVITGALLPGVSISDRVASHYDDILFDKRNLQDLAQEPEFIICATNVQTGSLMRFSRKRLADWQVGEVQSPQIRLASAVAASSAFPPVLSPAHISLAADAMQPWPGSTPRQPPYTTHLVLSDGGVYDNLGLEPVWKRCQTVLVSDAGQKMMPDPVPAEDWPRHMARVLDIIDNQVRSLRKRQVIGSLEAGDRQGAYWGIRTDIANYGVNEPLKCPHETTLQLAAIPTRLSALDKATQERLINWGYAVCDAAMRKHIDTEALAPGQFPYEIGV